MNNNGNGGQNLYNYQQPVNNFNIPEEYKPISMWGYFGYQILFSIPIIGFIFLLVYALGGTKNINVKNFARSYFCILIIVVIALAIFVTLFGFSTYK